MRERSQFGTAYNIFQKLFEPLLKSCADITAAACTLVDEDCVECGDRKQRQAWTKIKQRRALSYVDHLKSNKCAVICHPV